MKIRSKSISSSSYPLCEGMFSKTLKSEDLRRIIEKTKQKNRNLKKVVFKLRSFAHEVKKYVTQFYRSRQYYESKVLHNTEVT